MILKKTFSLDFEIDYKGTSKEEKDSDAALYYTFLIALIFAYLFLAGQFESFKNPIVIMSTVPLAITGALIGIAFSLFPLLTQFAIANGAPFWIQFVIPQFKKYQYKYLQPDRNHHVNRYGIKERYFISRIY